jgi:DNA repair exonuclease SbcCD ATPase subunit
MDREPVAIRRVTIENFRGFRDQQVIDLAASATIVCGSNGKGKTSFFDALQWLLLGSLGRLADLASRRSSDYVINSFADKRATATVSADLDLAGRRVTLIRTGARKETELQWLDAEQSLTGAEAQRELCEVLLGDPNISLAETMLTSGVLQQDVVRKVLQDEPKDRYRHMSALLGLKEIAGFETEAKSRAEERDRIAKSARGEHSDAASQLRELESELARLTQRLASEPEIAAARKKLEDELSKGAPAFDIPRLPAQASDAVALAQFARSIRAAADALLAREVTLSRQEDEMPRLDAKELKPLEADIKKITQETAEANEALALARARQQEARERASQLAELAVQALPLLGDHCPVCRLPIDPADVEVHLRELIDAGGENLPALSRASADAEERVGLLEARSCELIARRDELHSEADLRKQLGTARALWLKDCAALTRGDTRVRADEQEKLAAGDVSAIAGLRTSADRLTSIAEQLASLLGTSGLAEEVQRVREQVHGQVLLVRDLAEEAGRASNAADSAKTLATGATRAIAGVTKTRFESLQPLVDDIFARLAPHPAFTTLGFEMGVAYRSGVADPFVKDPESGVSADPLLVFSSSQANVAALTYFLALSWASTTKALPFLLLDDPLQSMDDVNALGFSDLCRHVRRRRQLVVSTHENRLASLLERKLAPRTPSARTRVLRFTGWDRSGPAIEQEDVEPEPASYLLDAG